MIYEREKNIHRSPQGISCEYYCEKNIGLLSEPLALSNIELAYCTEGRFEMWQSGTRYTFGEGDLAVINSETLHSIHSLDDSCGLILLRFDPEILSTGSSAATDYKFILPFALDGVKHQRIFSFVEISHTFIPDSIKNIYREYTDKNYGYELAAKSEICRIFLWILRYWNDLGINLSPPSVKTKRFLDRLSVVFEHVQNNCSEDITASDMARLCNMSPCYFSRMFKSVTRKSFSEYLNFVRISKAEKMLAATDKNITEIAYSCGFSSSSYFIQQFKKHKGASPRSYRFKNKFAI